MNCSVFDFGVRICDSVQTELFQKAIDAVFLNGGGEVIVPAGIYITGGLRLRSGVTLHLLTGAELEGSRNPDDYDYWRSDTVEPVVPGESANKKESAPFIDKWYNSLIFAINAENIGIIGEPGSFLNGANVYNPNGEEHYRGPHLICMWNCKNITLKGYTLKDSANWAHALFHSSDISVDNVTVYAGNDGLDIRTCDRVTVSNCSFYTGDDCIAGFDNIDVKISRCLFNTACSSLRFGGTDVLIEDCRSFAPAGFACRYHLPLEHKKAGWRTNENERHSNLCVFLYYCDHRAIIRKAPGNILIRNCDFENPDSLFNLNFSPEHQWCCNRFLSLITFENCRITGVCKPIFIQGDEAEPLHLTLRNVLVLPKEGCENQPVFDAFGFSEILLENTEFPSYAEPTALLRSEGKITATGCDSPKIVKASEKADEAAI